MSDYRACAGCDTPCGCPLTADVPHEPTGAQELRDAIVAALDDTATGLWMGLCGPGWGDVLAGVLLALPEMAALLADAERVRRVRTLVAAAEQAAERSSFRTFDGKPGPPSVWHHDLRRALDGTP